jgi:hypothetical protein
MQADNSIPTLKLLPGYLTGKNRPDLISTECANACYFQENFKPGNISWSKEIQNTKNRWVVSLSDIQTTYYQRYRWTVIDSFMGKTTQTKFFGVLSTNPLPQNIKDLEAFLDRPFQHCKNYTVILDLSCAYAGPFISTTTKTFYFNTRPLIRVGEKENVCGTTSSHRLSVYAPKGGNWEYHGKYITVNSSREILPSQLSKFPVGPVTIIYKKTDSFGCISSASKDLLILPDLQPAIISFSGTACPGDFILINANNLPQAQGGIRALYEIQNAGRTVGASYLNQVSILINASKIFKGRYRWDGCASPGPDGKALSVKVHTVKSFTVPTSFQVYDSDSNFQLPKGSLSPSGTIDGVWEGPGVGGIFPGGNYINAQTVPPGAYTIRFTYTNANECQTSKLSTLKVLSHKLLPFLNLHVQIPTNISLLTDLFILCSLFMTCT